MLTLALSIFLCKYFRDLTFSFAAGRIPRRKGAGRFAGSSEDFRVETGFVLSGHTINRPVGSFVLRDTLVGTCDYNTHEHVSTGLRSTAGTPRAPSIWADMS